MYKKEDNAEKNILIIQKSFICKKLCVDAVSKFKIKSKEKFQKIDTKCPVIKGNKREVNISWFKKNGTKWHNLGISSSNVFLMSKKCN